jgi:hypothetical protein
MSGEGISERDELKKSNQRMADVVSAAIRWRGENEEWGSGCDCERCVLIRAVDKYARSE